MVSVMTDPGANCTSTHYSGLSSRWRDQHLGVGESGGGVGAVLLRDDGECGIR